MIPKLCLLLGCAALACGAQPRKVFPYEYSQEDLPNGLRLISVPTDYANIVAVYIVVQTGSRNEVEAGTHRLRAPVRTPDVPRHREVSAGKIQPDSEPHRRGVERLDVRRFHRLPHNVFQGRPRNRAGHGGRPLPAPEVRRTRVQNRDPGRAGRIQQEQRLAVQQTQRSHRRTRPSTSTLTSTPPWAS